MKKIPFGTFRSFASVDDDIRLTEEAVKKATARLVAFKQERSLHPDNPKMKFLRPLLNPEQYVVGVNIEDGKAVIFLPDGTTVPTPPGVSYQDYGEYSYGTHVKEVKRDTLNFIVQS